LLFPSLEKNCIREKGIFFLSLAGSSFVKSKKGAKASISTGGKVESETPAFLPVTPDQRNSE
jgi:hypothetical protein